MLSEVMSCSLLMMIDQDPVDLDIDIFGVEGMELEESDGPQDVWFNTLQALVYRTPENTAQDWNLRLLDLGRLAR